MSRLTLVSAMILGCTACASAAVPNGLTSLSAIKALTNAEATTHMSVSFEATVTYFRAYEKVLFVQDGEAAIFVAVTKDLKLVPGDRVLVRGTMRASFRPYVVSSDVKVVGHGSLPKPVRGTFEAMIRAETDCKLVTVHAMIRSADLSTSPTFLATTTHLQMLVDGEQVEADVDSDDGSVLKRLLDAEVEITGVVSGRFDNKMQQTGVLFHVQSLAGVKILKPASVDPWSLSVTPMDQIATGHRVRDLSPRMRVRGAITYYQPGAALVLQDGSRSAWITTESSRNLRIGDLADAIGFPDVQNGFLTLTHSEIHDDSVQAPITPTLFTWHDLSVGGNEGRSHVFDLVSIEGQVVTEVRQATQDEYVLQAGGHLFSAILRHPGFGGGIPLFPMRRIPVGSRIRVAGICMLTDANPFNGEVPFNILMRSYDDIAVVASPPWLNVSHLIFLVGLLILAIFAVGARAWYTEHKMRRQISGLAYVEQRRSRILEAMNASRPLAEILDAITELASFKLNGASCWCDIPDGTKAGNRLPEASSRALRIVECAITAPSGSALGTIYASICGRTQIRATAGEVLSMASALAVLAIENSRLHSDLVHRSEFDLLTDIGNRFALEKNLDALIHVARQSESIFGLIYIDLNGFKQVNDQYGHQVGDIYLQQVAERMKRQVRPGDTLARVGGDEFAILVPNVQNRADLQEIALRLERCFDRPFALEENTIHGSASIGIALFPADATTKDGLFSAADTAMYTAKKARQRLTQMLAGELSAEAMREERP